MESTDKEMLPEDPNATKQSDMDRSADSSKLVKEMKKNNIKSLLTNPSTRPKVIGFVIMMVFFSAAGAMMVKRSLNAKSEESGLPTAVISPSSPGYEPTLDGSSSKFQAALKSKEDELKSKEAMSAGNSFVQTPNIETNSNPAQTISPEASNKGDESTVIVAQTPSHNGNYQDFDATLQQQQIENRKAQAETLMASWAPQGPKINQFQLADEKMDSAAKENVATSSTDKPLVSKYAAIKHYIKVGDLFYGRTDSEVSSDDGVETTATILSGPYKGSVLVGQLNVGKHGSAGLSYSLMSTKLSNKSVAVRMVAIDPSSNKKSLPADVDNHYLQRYGSLLASSFISGFSDAVGRSNTTINSGINGTTTSQGALSAKDRVIVATGAVGKAVATEALANVAIDKTVTIKAGQEIALMALSDVEFEETTQ